MKMEMFSVYDSKTELFMRPWFAINVASAQRTFNDEANDKSSPLSKHPEDYTLYHIGTFQDDTAMVVCHAQPKNLGFAKRSQSDMFGENLSILAEENLGDA